MVTERILRRGCPLTVFRPGPIRLGVLGPRGAWLDHPVAPVLLGAAGARAGEGHDGGAGVGRGVLGVGRVEPAQVFAGGVDGAVDGPLVGPGAVLLILVQIIGDSCF